MNWPYTEGNHLQSGRLHSDRSRPARTFVTRIGPCRRTPESPLKESIRAAQLIQQACGSELVLCMSAGVDSECMAQAFLAAGVPFRVAIAIYSKGLNVEDTDLAFDFCRRHGLKVTEIPIDLVTFFESGRHLHYADLDQCRSPQIAIHLEILSRVQGVPVMAWNPVDIGLRPSGKPDIFLPSEPHFAALRSLVRQKRPGVPFFFAYTPELISSFWQTPSFRSSIQDLKNRLAQRPYGILHRKLRTLFEGDLKQKSYLGKIQQYNEGGFTVTPRTSKKTGFEQAKFFFRDYYLGKGIENPNPHQEIFDALLRVPMEQRNPYPHHYIRLIPRDSFPDPDFFDQWFSIK